MTLPILYDRINGPPEEATMCPYCDYPFEHWHEGQKWLGYNAPFLPARFTLWADKPSYFGGTVFVFDHPKKKP